MPTKQIRNRKGVVSKRIDRCWYSGVRQSQTRFRIGDCPRKQVNEGHNILSASADLKSGENRMTQGDYNFQIDGPD